MKTIIISNYNKNDAKPSNLIFGILMILISLSGLFMGSTLALKLLVYIFPIIILIFSIKSYKMAQYFFKKDIKRFIIFITQAIFLTTFALYILFFPIESLNFIIIGIGILTLISNINNMIIYNSKRLSFTSFIFSLICMLFSKQIINIFYTILLLFILFIGISKTTTYFINIAK